MKGIRYWQNLMGLGHWKIEYKCLKDVTYNEHEAAYGMEPNTSNGHCLPCLDRFLAYINVRAGRTENEKEYTIVHELTHLHMSVINAFVANHILEQITNRDMQEQLEKEFNEIMEHTTHMIGQAFQNVEKRSRK